VVPLKIWVVPIQRLVVKKVEFVIGHDKVVMPPQIGLQAGGPSLLGADTEKVESHAS
jgi:hypothetical protein